MQTDLEGAMRGRSTDELRAVCSTDAGDYTAEALAAARAELVRRGEDVQGLVPAPARTPPPDPQRQGAQILLGLLVVAALVSPWLADLPTTARVLITSAISAAAMVGARLWAKR